MKDFIAVTAAKKDLGNGVTMVRGREERRLGSVAMIPSTTWRVGTKNP